jgi:class 3 adenylate cyclase
MSGTWNYDRAEERIEQFLEQVETVEIAPFTRQTDILDLPVNKAYVVPAAHFYIDIVNARTLLDGDAETEQLHKRALRFLNLHQRATDVILDTVEVLKVDFHNQRLHAVVTHPLNDEAGRIHKAIVVADMVTQLLGEVTDPDDKNTGAIVRVGIDSGRALAVTNGRRNHREPLFLGNPPNLAAKLAAAKHVAGIYLTNNARAAIGLQQVGNPHMSPLTAEEIKGSYRAAGETGDISRLRTSWQEELKKTPLSAFSFTRPTPPLRDFEDEFDKVGPQTSRRIDSVTLFADIDGFTRYVSSNLDDPRGIVRALHVMRSEMHAVLREDFGALKVRFIGDAIHGVLAEGETDTDAPETISVATLAAGGLRSSFELAKTRVDGVAALGLAIGFDYGPAALTRLGVRGELNRCGIGRATYGAEDEQQRAKGRETAIGQRAYNAASRAVKQLFTDIRLCADLTYDKAAVALAARRDRAAAAAVKVAQVSAPPAVARASEYTGRSHVT